MLNKVLLVCGILAAALYVASDIVAAMSWEGYSYTAQSVSELRAVGAPTRAFLMPILLTYTMLEIAFGFGVWRTAGQKRGVRIAGALLIALGVLEFSTPFIQLNINEGVESPANTLHLIATIVTLLLLLLIIGFGAMADGKWFRLYSYLTLIVFLVVGLWAFSEVPRIADNLPTPWMGVKERTGIYGYMLWMAMLAIVRLRAPENATAGKPPATLGPPQLTPR